MNNKKAYKRKVSDDLIIKSYIENQSYKKVAGLLKCTEWNVRKVINANRSIVPELQSIFANSSNNFQSYYQYKRDKNLQEIKDPNIYINNNNKNKEYRNKNKEKETYKEKESDIAASMVTDIDVYDFEPLPVENGLPQATRIEENTSGYILPLPENSNNNINNNNIYIPNNINNKDNDTNNISLKIKDSEDKIFTNNKNIISKIDTILDITLKKLNKSVKNTDLTAKDLSEIINKLISRKIDLVDSKKEDKKANNTINIFGSPDQAMKLLQEMKRINKKSI
jgi:rRNA processing protein Gar1